MSEQWTTVIRPKSRLLALNLRELLQYKFLMFLFVRRDFVAQYKQTILGPLWFAIQPLFTTGIYSVIFGALAKVPTDGVPQPVFYMAGTTLWNYFAACVTGAAGVFQANAGVFGKVYFPRLTVPITMTITKLFIFMIQMVLFLVVYFVYLFRGTSMHPNLWLLFLPVVIAQTALLGMGVGLCATALTVKYRDLSILIGFGMGLWMWATPIVYPLSLIPEQYRFLAYLNPMAAVVEVFRYAFTGAGAFPVTAFVASAAVSVLLIFLGLVLFHRAEQTFVDVA